jgi:hypothetical protein
MNQMQLFDNNFVLLRETDELFSPLSMVHYHYYEKQEEVEHYLTTFKDKIQVVIGQDYTSFGVAQSPTLYDYADGIDVMKWLEKL